MDNFELDRYFLSFPELKWLKDKPPKLKSSLPWYKEALKSSWTSTALGIPEPLTGWLLEPEQELLRRCWAWHEPKLSPDIKNQFQEIKNLEADPNFQDSTEIDLHKRWLGIYVDDFKAAAEDVHDEFERKTGLKVTQDRLDKIRKGKRVEVLRVRPQMVG